MTNKADILIVGAGQAGAYAAIALRHQGFSGTITMIGEEASLPYERPPLSKDYFTGEKSFERLLIRPQNFWAERQITLLTGQRVISVDSAAHHVTTDKGQMINYELCIWAAGGAPRHLTCAGATLPGVHTFRTRADADAILAQLKKTDRVVIVGGGYIGLESAAAMVKKGKKVTLLEVGNRVLARVAGESISHYFEQLHRANGVDLRVGVGIDQFVGTHQVQGVRLATGESIPCEMAIVGIGIIPSVAPLLAAGAKGGNGVDVNSQCQTSLPDIYAIGDCALHHNRFANGAAIRLESVQNANDQAMVAAQSIIGKTVDYEAIPWFWSNQYDVKLQTIGLSIGYDETVVKGDPNSHSFTAFYLRNGQLIAADCVNAAKDFVQSRKLILEKAHRAQLPM